MSKWSIGITEDPEIDKADIMIPFWVDGLSVEEREELMGLIAKACPAQQVNLYKNGEFEQCQMMRPATEKQS